MNALEKLTIYGYAAQEGQSPQCIGVFKAFFNPASYSQKHEVDYSEVQAAGSSKVSYPFNKVKPREYAFELILDGTGTAGDSIDVSQSVDDFLKLTGELNSAIRRPNYLLVAWGTLAVTCVLRSADVTFNLFDSGGRPLRAKITCAFRESVDIALRVAEERRRPTDAVQVRTISAGDTLSNVAQSVYGDATMAAALARHNRLPHLRAVEPGATLTCPLDTQLPIR